MVDVEDLLAEGAAVPVDGWDFSWFEGRATEQRPSWGYARLMGTRMASVTSALDMQTGGGEVLSGIPKPPRLLVATEGWTPNVRLARARLVPLGARVVHVREDSALPFADQVFDLVVSRHPLVVRWPEVARVLVGGGTFLSQLVGAGSVGELTEYMTGHHPVSNAWTAERAAAAAGDAGLDVVDLRSESLRVEFFDVAAVVVFLRKVIWIVPGFTVPAYRDRLLAMHRLIQSQGPFVAYAKRFLIEARKPG